MWFLDGISGEFRCSEFLLETSRCCDTPPVICGQPICEVEQVAERIGVWESVLRVILEKPTLGIKCAPQVRVVPSSESTTCDEEATPVQRSGAWTGASPPQN